MARFDTQTILRKYWGWGILLLWGGLILALGLLRMTPYGIDEAAARSLLLDWSIMDRVANPIAFYGIPDFRILLLAPPAMYWTGSMVAAKVWMLLLGFAAVVFLYRWSRRLFGAETALVAGGLLLISPLWLQQLESLSTGPLLLLLFAIGAGLNGRYHASKRVLGGWYFMLMIAVAAAVSLHPAGLAFPLALIMHWRQQKDDPRRQKDIYIGSGIAVLFVLLMWAGWTDLAWFGNPLAVLGQAMSVGFSVDLEASSGLGALLFLIFAGVAALNRQKITSDLVASSLFFGVLIGSIAADLSWALLLLVFILFFGFPLLSKLNDRSSTQGLFGKRGFVMVLCFILGNTFLLADKTHRQSVMDEQLAAKDMLIRLLEFEVEDAPKDEIKIASEWPGLTMLLLKRPIWPLPPASLSDEKMIEAVEGLDLLVFDPAQSNNQHLVKAVANMTGVTQTLVREPSGVVVGVSHHAMK